MTHSHRRTAYLTGAAALAIVIGSVPASAAEQSAADTQATERSGDIVVTARKRDERQIDVPVSLSVVGGAQLARGEHLRLEELNTLVPGVNISISTPRQATFSIRGLGANPANDGLEQSVGLFLDGIYLAKPGMAVIDLIDVDRVEVLRGPQGTLVGKNTTGGAINIYTKGPSFTPGATIRTSAGNYGYVQLQGSVTGPLTDTVAARVTMYRTSRDGWVYNPFLREHTDGLGREGVRAQLLFKPTTDFRLRLIGEIHRENDSNYALTIPNAGVTPATLLAGLDATGGTIAYSPNGHESSYDSPTIIKSTQHALTALLDWDLGGVSVASVTGYRNWKYYTISDIDGSSAPMFRGSSDLHYHQFSQELRLSSRSTDRFKWTVGGYFFSQNTDYTSSVYYDSLAASQLSKLTPAALIAAASKSAALAKLLAYNNSRWDTNATPHTDSYAVFGQATWAATPTVNITGGARATYEQKRMTVWRDAPVSSLTGAVIPALTSSAYPAAGVQRSDWSPSLLLTVDYKPRPELMFYATVSHGEKAGGLNAAVPATGLGPNSLQVDPEAATNFEGGVKGELFNRAVTFALDGFYTRVSDYQASYDGIPDGGSAPVQLLTNVGKVETKGIEFEFSARLGRHFNVGVNGAYIDATYKSYHNAPCPAGVTSTTSCDLTGRPVASSPKWMANAHADYEYPASSSADVYLGGELSWRSSFYGSLDDAPQSKAGNYALLNLRAGLKSINGRWDLGIWVKNATNKSYALSYTNYGALIPGVYLPYVGDPRTYGMSTTINF